MVSNLAIGNKGPKRNLFPFISQMQTTYFYGNFGHAVNQKAGVPVQAGTYQTYWSVPYCKDLSATVWGVWTGGDQAGHYVTLSI